MQHSFGSGAKVLALAPTVCAYTYIHINNKSTVYTIICIYIYIEKNIFINLSICIHAYVCRYACATHINMYTYLHTSVKKERKKTDMLQICVRWSLR